MLDFSKAMTYSLLSDKPAVCYISDLNEYVVVYKQIIYNYEFMLSCLFSFAYKFKITPKMRLKLAQEGTRQLSAEIITGVELDPQDFKHFNFDKPMDVFRLLDKKNSFVL